MDDIDNLLKFCIDRAEKEAGAGRDILLDCGIFVLHDIGNHVIELIKQDQCSSKFMGLIRTTVGLMLRIGGSSSDSRWAITLCLCGRGFA
jgi:hypothetical protein